MAEKLEFKTDSPILLDIFNFVMDNYTELDNFELIMNKYIDDKTKAINLMGDDEKEQIIKDFEEKNFYDTKLYNRKQISNKDFFSYVMLCSHVKGEIHENLCPSIKEENMRWEGCGKLERKVSPPIEAFKYKSDSSGVKQSDKSYGLLFE